MREAKQRQLQQERAPNEHDRHLRDTGGIGSGLLYPDPYRERLIDFTEQLRPNYKEKDGA